MDKEHLLIVFRILSAIRVFLTKHRSVLFLQDSYLKNNRTPTNERGFGLVEVLVATLVFAGSALAIMNMHNRASQSVHDTAQRSQAVWLVNSAVELMQINPAGFGQYESEAISASSNLSAFCSTTPKVCISTSCSPNEMASFDMYDLMCQQAQQIAEPEIDITCAASPCNTNDLVNVKVSWSSRGALDKSNKRQKVAFQFLRN
ncbi:type IV pilus modification protein PilV [uncultured Endozoicomonas sp.]|uniref:type IV pilus modification protein PilV n=1 Tax=uncultured Endozoicomonas sp. TaxID=432652 RepID=UPI00262EBAFB|nr:type IV pilus modification protein PilV [uncultured Endozoicomonas sp.]